MLGRGGLRQAAKVAHYCLIALAAYAAAVVVVRAASLDLEPEMPAAAKSDDDSKKDRTKRDQDDAIILKRNLFGVATAESGDASKVATGGGDLRLRGVAASADRSFAVFENLESGEQNVFAVGEKVFEGPKLVSVDAGGADVMVRGRKRRYEIEEEEPSSSGEETATKKKGKDAAAPSSKKADTGGVRKTGETAWLVDRREIDAAVADLNQVITQARAVPVMKDGQSNGFKLFQIRPGSIFEKLGLKDGDIVQRVNDTELTDPSKAVGLLEEVQSMGEIRVNVVRGGKPQTYTYTVR